MSTEQAKIDHWYNPQNIYKKIIIETPRSNRKTLVELYNCNEEYLKTVKKVICIHPANHSVALFLKMMKEADLCLYCHPLLAKESSKDFVISYVQKFNYPLVILTRLENLEDLMRKNGAPTKFRRWCTRMFKIEPVRLFYKTYITSGVVEYIGIQKFQSKERGDMLPELKEDGKSQKRYKIFSQLPIFYETEEYNTKMIEEANIEPFYNSIRGYNRYGCFLCPFAGKTYYEDLKENDSETYCKCNELMQLASEPQIQSGERKGRYYYYPKTKIM